MTDNHFNKGDVARVNFVANVRGGNSLCFSLTDMIVSGVIEAGALVTVIQLHFGRACFSCMTLRGVVLIPTARLERIS